MEGDAASFSNARESNMLARCSYFDGCDEDATKNIGDAETVESDDL